MSEWLRGHPKLSPFSQAYKEYAGGGGQWTLYVFFIKVDCDALNFHTGSLKNQHVQSALFGGRGSQKEYAVYAFDNVDNGGRPPYNNGVILTVSQTAPI